MRRTWPVLALLVCSGVGVVRADTWSEEILLDKLDLYSGEFGRRLRLLSMEVIDLHLDVRHEKARVRVGAGGESLSLHLDSDVHWLGDGWARVDARFEVNAFHRRMELRLPTFDISLESVGEKSGVAVRVPLFERKF